jgi:hypothetical protein
LGERNVRNVQARGSNPLSSTTPFPALPQGGFFLPVSFGGQEGALSSL